MSSQNGTQGYQSTKSENGIAADIVVDLRSDTLTLPSQGMRDAIANAVLGDDVFLEDPTTKSFEERVAKLLGKEAALLVTSGTQGNLLCNLVHCNVRGSEIICGDQAHVFQYEQGNIAQFGGIHSCQLPNEPDGTFSIDALRSKFRENDFHYPITKLVCVENTHNRCGGRVLPLKWLDELAEVCKERNVPIHMDGARLFNAATTLGVPPSRIVRDVSSVSVCLSKGLGAPIGSVIVGTRPFIEQARRLRKGLGGGMRQNGMIAAAGLYILDNMISRLADDHENAKVIAKIVNDNAMMSKRRVYVNVSNLETNIIMLEVGGCLVTEFCARLGSVDEEERAAFEEQKKETVIVKCFPMTPTCARLVTHFNISREMAEMAAHKVIYVANFLSMRKTTTAV